MPNNIGSLSCFDLVTEPGTIVGPHPSLAGDGAPRDRPDAGRQRLRLPCPGAARHGAGGECGPIWILSLYSAHGRVPPEQTAKARNFAVINMGLGGIGGRPGKDGLATTAFPRASAPFRLR